MSSSLRPLLLLAGAIGLMFGVLLVGAGLYYALDSGGSQATRSLALERLTDPGSIYDRAPNGTRGAAATVTPGPVQPPPFGDAGFRIVIPRISVDAEVVAAGLDSQNVPEVPLNGYDVAWYNFSARPGVGSNAVFAGHVTWNGQAVFYNLDSVAVGDDIVLNGENGAQLRYKVVETYLVDPNDPASLQVMAPTTSDMVTIITCGGTFFYTDDPVFGGDYTDRRIIRAALNAVEPPQSAAVPG